MNVSPNSSCLLTGVPDLDDIVPGDPPRGHAYRLEGCLLIEHTTLATQLTLRGKRQGERCLYVTLPRSNRLT